MGRSMVHGSSSRTEQCMDLHLSGACVVKLCSHAFLAQGLHMDCFYLKQGLSLSYYTILQCNAILLAASLVSLLSAFGWLARFVNTHPRTNISCILYLYTIFQIFDVECQKSQLDYAFMLASTYLVFLPDFFLFLLLLLK